MWAAIKRLSKSAIRYVGSTLKGGMATGERGYIFQPKARQSSLWEGDFAEGRVSLVAASKKEWLV